MFRGALQKIVDHLPGAVSGVVMGFDGISVASYSPPPPGGGGGQSSDSTDIGTIGMELSLILRQATKAAQNLELGGIEEITVRTDKLTVLARILSKEYFFAVAIGPDASVGKGRFLMRVTAPSLQAEL